MVIVVNIKRIQTVQWKLNNEMAFTILQVGIISLYIIITKLLNKRGIKEKIIKTFFLILELYIFRWVFEKRNNI